jgi:hypothetical protein
MDASGPTYILSQWLFLKLLGVVYAIAFSSLLFQVDGLYGSKGVLPIGDFIGPFSAGKKKKLFSTLPSLFLFQSSDAFLKSCAGAGVVLSLLLLAGVFPPLMLLLLWLLYLSFVSVGQEFLSFQWDALLLETGFMAIFFALLTPPPMLAVVAWWFFLFRFIVSSGAVKWTSGDPNWRNLTALCTHYETQPLPNRIAWYVHQLPVTVLKFSTFGTFFFELAVPFLIWGPEPVRYGAFWLTVFFQGLILLTGSYCFFNLLTIALAIPLLADHHLRWLETLVFLPVSGAADTVLPAVVSVVFAFFLILNVLQLLALFYRPYPIGRLLVALSRWGITSPYGLFAVMTTRRFEFVIEGRRDNGEWLSYEFRWKPGDPASPPRQAAPHQPRLDWQMWFAALNPAMVDPWVINFVNRLLEGSKPVLALLKTNPFAGNPPRSIRLVVYRYHFTDWRTRKATGNWWQRELVGESEPFSLSDGA